MERLQYFFLTIGLIWNNLFKMSYEAHTHIKNKYKLNWICPIMQ